MVGIGMLPADVIRLIFVQDFHAYVDSSTGGSTHPRAWNLGHENVSENWSHDGLLRYTDREWRRGEKSDDAS